MDFDDDEDYFLFMATQEVERQEGILAHEARSIPVNIPKSSLPRSGSMESITPAENLALRRQRLEDKSLNAGEFSKSLGASDKDLGLAKETIKALEEKISSLTSEVHRFKGEAGNLRRKCDSMNTELQEDTKKKITQQQNERELVKNLEEKYNKDTQDLKAKLREKECDIIKLKMKSPRVKTPVSNNIVNVNASISTRTGSESFTSAVQPSVPPKQIIVREAVEQASKEVQTNPVKLEDEDSAQKLSKDEAKLEIFRTVERMVDLRFQMVLPTLEGIVKAAPREIMRRLVPGCDIKSAFPDIVDSMFQWGIDKERRKIRSLSGLIDPSPPKLAFQYERGVYFHELKMGIEVRYKYGGVWGALKEVREGLQQLLKSLEGEGRFRMYETTTLTNFWKLLFWANELWRCILFQEEDLETVEKHRSLWAKELQGWTGLVLKCDWRDYFIIELEIEVRKLTLNILESIVTTGYFEPTPSRYEILYRVLKDTAVKDSFRNAQNFQRVLKIINWSISDKLMLKHLCYNNNTGNCLAKIIGENFVKLCRQESNRVTISLFLDYFYLLETLMQEKPSSNHLNNIVARPEVDKENKRQEAMEEDDESAMLAVGTQLACPIKFNILPKDIPKHTPEERDQGCWLAPSNYEDPFSKLNLCQCRKILVGSAIFVLEYAFKHWLQRRVEFEEELESLEIEEQDELYLLERKKELYNLQTTANLVQQLTTEEVERLAFLREKQAYLKQLIPKANAMFKTFSDDIEWNMNDLFRRGRNLLDKKHEWLKDCKREGDIFDLAICKGIRLMNFLQNGSENLAAAIGTEAYKVFMTLTPLLRLSMAQLDFNRVDRNILISVTSECEEDNYPSQAIHYSMANSDSIQSVTTDFKFPSSLQPLSATERLSLRKSAEADIKKLRSHKTSDDEVQLIHDMLPQV